MALPFNRPPLAPLRGPPVCPPAPLAPTPATAGVGLAPGQPNPALATARELDKQLCCQGTGRVPRRYPNGAMAAPSKRGQMAVRRDEERPGKQTRQPGAGWLPARLIAWMAARDGCVHLARMAGEVAKP